MTFSDQRFLFIDGLGNLSCCQVRLAIPEADDEKQPDFALVIVSILASNSGASPTNAFEQLAPQIAGAFDLEGQTLVYIEHYGPFSYTDGERDEEFARVTFDYAPDERPPFPGAQQLAGAAQRLEDERPVTYPLEEAEGPVEAGKETVATLAWKLRAAHDAGHFSNPSWSVITREGIEELLGCQLPPFAFSESPLPV